MNKSPARQWFAWLRWLSLGAAVAILVVFLLAQRQSIDVSYGRSPSSTETIKEGSAGELGDETVPSVDKMTAMVGADPVVRLPGSIAYWDEQRVRATIGEAEVKILVAPPGLDKDERDRVRRVKTAKIRIIGTEVSGGIYQASADGLADWRSQFATGDVTDLVITMIRALRHEESLPDSDQLRWRDPSTTEVTAVAADLRKTGVYRGEGATLTDVPAEASAAAFPSGALYVALPQQPFGKPVPRYGPALGKLFPDKPIVVLYGSWVEYHGPNAADFAEVAAASYYGQLADRLAKYAYPQRTVLFSYLNKVTDVRYAGLFDRPLPYQPLDPLRVALPALPWLFAGCVLVFLALSVRSLLRPASGSTRRLNALRWTGTPARLAGLTALAIEVSALTDKDSDPALTRAITKLGAASEALSGKLPDRHVRSLLDSAETELDDTARALGRTDYRPDNYLQGRLE